MATTQKSNKSLVIVAAVIGILVLITGSFLIGRALAPESKTPDSNEEKSSQVTKLDSDNEADSTEPETVFDSTEEELEEVKEEQEKVEQETEQKVDTVVQTQEQIEPETQYKKYTYKSPTSDCTLVVLYTGSEESLSTTQYGEINMGDSGYMVECRTPDKNPLAGAGVVVGKEDVRTYLTTNRYDQVSEVRAFGFKTGVSYNISFQDTDSTLFLTVTDTDKTNGYLVDLVPSTPTTQAVTTETYTNQYFPDFKLVYPSDWEFSTTTQTSAYYPELLNRTIELRKDGAALSFGLQPLSRVGCGGPGSSYTPEAGFTTSSGLSEYAQEGAPGTRYYYQSADPSVRCALEDDIKTTIKESSIKNYDDGDSDNAVSYFTYIWLELPFQGENNESIIEEARQILENSTIR